MYKKLLSILIIVLLTFHFSGTGQSVNLRCTKVMPDGDAVIYWNPLGDGTGFNNYTIYYSSALEGPYTELTVIKTFSDDSCHHAGAAADIAPVYYYLITTKDLVPSPPSDILATMLLSSSTIDFEVIDLSWTPLHTQPPFLPGMHPWYLLYREYPTGNWALVDSVQDLSMTHHFWACNDSDTVKFRIDVRDITTGCISRSNQIGEVLKNVTKPDQPIIDSVSIGPDEKVIIGWQAGLEPDIYGYIIYQFTPTSGFIDPIDTVIGISYTYYLHEYSSPCDGPLYYVLSTIDSCGNNSPYSYDANTSEPKPYNSIYLENVTYNPCQMTNTLNWNEYVNFEPPLQGYRIYMSENNGTFQLLETLNPGDTNFPHADIQPNTTYAYYVRAFNQGGQKTSTSCRKEITTYNSPRPEFMYINYVSVEDNDRVNLLFYTDTKAHVQYYRILRSNYAGGPYAEIDTLQDEGQDSIFFSDTEAEVTAESYYYQIEVVDSCGMASIIANTSRTIFLQAEALPDLTNRLSWNAYESWYGTVEGYRIYRRLNDNPALELLDEVSANDSTFTDDVSGLTGNTSRITYIVEAYEGLGNPLGFQEQSFSNEVLSEQESKVYLPNAIMPMSLIVENKSFKPGIVFVGSEGYEFLIYDRWGQMVFRSNDPEEGWDGTYNGDYVPMGVYVYLVRFRNAMNQPRQIKGNVAVIY